MWRGEGLEPDPYAGAFRGLFVDLAPPSFAWEQPRGKVVRLRPVPDTAGARRPWLDELEPPLVYVTMGTVYNQPELFRPLLDGLDGHGSALVTVGRNVEPDELGPLPPRVRVERFVPQAHILPRAEAVVSHGGSGTTLGALAHGLPLVLVPQAADQFDNAARAEAAGAAVVLRPGEVTAESVRAALGRVLGEPAFAEAARAVAAEIGEMATVGRGGHGSRGARSRWRVSRLAACLPRARTALIVAALAALAAVVVAGRGGALRGRARLRSGDRRPAAARKGFPPLALSLGVRDDAEARELRRAVELYEAGRRRRSAPDLRPLRLARGEARRGVCGLAGEQGPDRAARRALSAQRARPAARRARALLGRHRRCVDAPGARPATSSPTRPTPCARTT